METYFTFPSGALRYDCERCGQRCCRGKGFAVGEEEARALIRLHPRAAAQLRLRPGGTFAAFNVTDGCWFLRGDGMCRVEAEHGRAAKPSTCRLFPFNRVYLAGEVRIIDMNSVLCPLEPAQGDGVTHEELLSELAALQGSPLLGTPAPAPADLDPGWLSVERCIAALASERGVDPDALARAQGATGVEEAWRSWVGLMGADAMEARRAESEVAPRVALLLPSLRWNRIFRRGDPCYARTLARLPLRLRGLTLLGALAGDLRGAALSLRALSELWEERRAELDVLECWPEQVRLRAPRFSADVPALLERPLGALLSLAYRGGRSLGELVIAAAEALPNEERPLMLTLAAGQLSALTLLPS